MIEIISEPPPINYGVGPRDCCQIKSNLEHHYLATDLVVLRCRSCGARHFEITAQPGELIAKQAEMALSAYREWEEVQKRIHHSWLS